MKQQLTAFLAGVLFGLGLVISQMTNPYKVIAFLTVFDKWDPSLMFVMASAMFVTAIGYRFLRSKEKPAFAESFQFPSNRKIDRRLMSGAMIFGVGWGIAGLCPGPAIAALSIGGWDAVLFMLAMLTGMAVFRFGPWTTKPEVRT